MATFLHLVKGDASAMAAPVIEANVHQPDARVTVVLLGAATLPTLPSAVHVRRLAHDDLDHSGLLDLIFQSDHVVTW